ncbi:glycosyltransferase family 2 protein [Akkermansia sp.]|uniref:glycosyltransferase family 2 protein n=1 Tax=Akkermansia sp. TaxID=1872421 RepID=UPI00266BF581|nr:glycosyltransferase family 2 protein [uncultured Akkermansia sp.]
MKISVITVCYNSVATLQDTLESVLRQTYPDVEYIVVDGASKDGTRGLIEKYAPKFSGRMKWISEPDQGIYDAMNKGLRMAKGDVIGFLNADDYYQDNHVLSDIARVFCEHPETDAIHGNLDYINRERKVVRTWRGKEYAPGAFQKGWSPAHPTFYCKRQCFEQYGPFVPSIGSAADFELMLRFTERFGIRTRHLKRSMVFMRTGGSSTNGFRAIMRNTKQNRQAFLLNSLPCPRLYPIARLWNKVFSVKNPFNYLSQ